MQSVKNRYVPVVKSNVRIRGGGLKKNVNMSRLSYGVLGKGIEQKITEESIIPEFKTNMLKNNDKEDLKRITESLEKLRFGKKKPNIKINF